MATLKYLDKGKNSKIIESSFSSASTFEELAKDFVIFDFLARQAKRDDIIYKALHLSLSFDPTTEIDELKMRGLNRLAVYNLYGDTEYVSITHWDRPHKHVHTLISLYKADGSKVNRSFDYYRAKQCCRELELLAGFKEIDNQKAEKKLDHKVQHALLHSYDLHKKTMWEILDQARHDAKNLDQYIAISKENGVKVQIRHEGHNPIGVSYSFTMLEPMRKFNEAKAVTKPNKFVVKGSTLGKAYMLPSLFNQFTENANHVNHQSDLNLQLLIKKAIMTSPTLQLCAQQLEELEVKCKRGEKDEITFINRDNNMSIALDNLGREAMTALQNLIDKFAIEKEHEEQKRKEKRSRELPPEVPEVLITKQQEKKNWTNEIRL